jgi:iron complex transport system substrate-binding protein
VIDRLRNLFRMAPLRIVSLVSSATEILFGLGLGNQVVGVSHECDWPAEANSRPRVTRSRIDSSANSGDIDAEVRSLLEQGAPLYELDVGLLESLRPDLVVTQAQCDVCAVSYAEVELSIRSSAKLKKAAIVALSPQSLGDVFNDIVKVGEAANVFERARAYHLELESRVDRVRRRCETIPIDERARTCVVEWFDPIIIAGNWVPELIEIAGGRCDLSTAGAHSPTVEWETLRQYDPEVMILAPCGFDVARAHLELPILSTRDGFSAMNAVLTDRVHIMDGNAYFNRPGPRLVDTVEWLAHLIHPKLISQPLSAADSTLLAVDALAQSR